MRAAFVHGLPFVGTFGAGLVLGPNTPGRRRYRDVSLFPVSYSLPGNSFRRAQAIVALLAHGQVTVLQKEHVPSDVAVMRKAAVRVVNLARVAQANMPEQGIARIAEPATLEVVPARVLLSAE